MKVELIPVNKSNQEKIYNLWNYYIYDMSEYTGWSSSPEGLFVTDRPHINEYWERNDHYPFLIECDGELAGFSLLRRFPTDLTFHEINAFFVLRKYKGTGVGRKAFRLCVSKLPGKWLTRVIYNNTGALKFWIAVIGEMTNDTYTKTSEMHTSEYGENKMHFIRYETQNS